MFGTWRFYVWIPLGLVATAVLWGLLVIGQFGAPTAGGGWIGDVYAAKEAAVARADAPKLLIVGGESVHFGIDAQALGTAVALPTRNLGTHQAFGLGYLLDRARPHLRTGDRVVLQLEYELFASPGSSSDFATDARLTRGWRLFADIETDPRGSLVDIAELVLRTSPTRVARGYWAMVERPEVIEPYESGAISATGDALGTGPDTRIEALWRARVDAPPTFPPAFPLSSVVVSELEAFVALCRQRGIAVVAAWPAVQRKTPFGTRAYERFFDAVAALYDRLGVPVLADPYTFIRPPSDFLAGPYQVHARTREQLTRAMAVLLRRDTDMLAQSIVAE